MDIKLVIDTLKMAIYKREDITDLIIHTDRGSQYTSKEYRKLCAKRHKHILQQKRKSLG